MSSRPAIPVAARAAVVVSNGSFPWLRHKGDGGRQGRSTTSVPDLLATMASRSLTIAKRACALTPLLARKERTLAERPLRARHAARDRSTAWPAVSRRLDHDRQRHATHRRDPPLARQEENARLRKVSVADLRCIHDPNPLEDCCEITPGARPARS